MTPIDVEARCDKSRRHDTEILDPDPYEALHDFALDLASSEPAVEDRASKRRRTDKDASYTIPSLDDHNSGPKDYLTLADTTLNLHIYGLHHAPSCSWSHVPVSLRCTSHSPDLGGLVSVTLSQLSNHPSDSITLVIDLRSHSSISQLLGNLSSLPLRRSKSTAASNGADVCWADCRLVAPSSTSPHFALRIGIYWKTGISALSRNRRLHASLYKILTDSFPIQKPILHNPWSPHDFYSNVHIPDPTVEVSPSLQDPALDCELYPFQKRAVDWLLRREGVQFNSTGSIEPLTALHTLPTSFEPSKDALRQPCYISPLLMEANTNIDAQINRASFSGGVLAEEMGLGKTVELIALILAHRRAGNLSKDENDEYTGVMVRPSRSTLIITPPAILEQWMSELATHAPSLKVYHYKGVKQSPLQSRALRNELLEQDVVLTTYQVLAREIHYTNDKPPRDLRHSKRYEAPRTPLVQIGWWRVCLDEAQMIESGVSNAARVARLIPRCNAWAVSGTPLRKDVTDLLGLLIFLRYEPFCNLDVWNFMISSHKYLLSEIFGQLALRHTKSKIRDELVLPPQKRMVITVPFTRTEEQNYNDLFKQMCDDCGLNKDGSPLLETWDPNSSLIVERMRTWLMRLRQTCLHAEIGSRNRRALGNRDGPLRTVDEVLEVMIDQNEIALRTREREALTRKITRGHVHSFGKESKRALELYLEALEESKVIVSECRGQLEEEKTRARQLAEGKDTDLQSGDSDSDSDATIEDEKKGRLGACRLRLRSALEILHVCYFFAGTGYFQVKDNPMLTRPASNAFGDLERKEAECYEQAKLIRKELLSEVIKKTTRLIEKVITVRSTSLVRFPQIPASSSPRGLESRKISEKIEDIRTKLNEQAKAFEEWRGRLLNSLVEKLLDQDEDVEMTGEEYELTTSQQNEQYVLLEALRCVHSDRLCMITGQIGTLVNHELKVALKQAKDGTAAEPDNKGPAPDLMISIMAARDTFNPMENIKATLPNEAVKTRPLSLRSIMTDLRQLITAVQWQGSDRSKVETQILEDELQNLQAIFNAQMKELTAMEKETDLLRSTMNQRLDFYRQLQQISDTVAPFQEEAGESIDIQRLAIEQAKEDKILERLSVLKTKRRFLNHLRNVESSDDKEQKICVICQSPFEIGVLTVCGHQYCKECIRLWWSQHRTCPMCKTYLRSTDFHDITFKPQELRAHEETNPSSEEEENQSPTQISASKASIYADINPGTLSEIKTVELPGSQSFGVKIDTLARHLLWIRQNDPGSKSVIFSQYRDFLTVLSRAFQIYKIGCSEMGSKDGIKRFREDPSIECFLLHAKAESSGLTLVNATYVFLCEPLINTAIELQAIARVHRIGQRRPTTVWMYLVANTVEEAIYDISVTRRLAHIQKSGASSRQRSRAVTPSMGGDGAVEESKLDAANSLELQTAPISKLLTKGPSGGELVQKDDLWSCLFTRPNANSQTAAGALEGISSESPGAREMSRFLRAEAAESRRDGN